MLLDYFAALVWGFLSTCSVQSVHMPTSAQSPPQCSIDGGPWFFCSETQEKIHALTDGEHSFDSRHAP